MPTPDRQQQSNARARRASREPRVRIFTVTSRRIESRDCRSEYRVPFLRLSGRWLERCGFATDAVVEVKPRKGRLVLTIKWAAPAPEKPAKSMLIAEPPPRRRTRRARLAGMRRTLRLCAISCAAGARPLVAARTAKLRASLRAELDNR